MARCAWCGREFEPHHGRQRFCCDRCRYEDRKRRWRERYHGDAAFHARMVAYQRARRGSDREQEMDVASRCAAALDGDARLMAMMMCGATLRQLEDAWLGGD